MLTDFQRLLIQNGWAYDGVCMVAGVSGGVDSMVLLHLLHLLSEEMNFRVIAAHLNHRLRGEESDRDERFVREISEKWGIPVEIGREDVGEIAKREKLPVQVSARVVRYRFFEQVMRKHGGNCLVLGHQADDVAETVVMRLLRGSSVGGLRGIPIQNGYIIRPLLPFTREEIIAYADREKIPYVEDSSNKKMRYLRNRIRHLLIPQVEREYQPAFSRHLLRYASYFDEIHAYLSEVCSDLSREIIGKDGVIYLNKFRKLHVALQRILIENYLMEGGWIKEPLSFEQLEGILKIVKASGGTRRYKIRKDLWIIREYDKLKLSETLEEVEIQPVTCRVPGSIEIKEIGNRLNVEVAPFIPKDLRSNSQEAYVNGDKIDGSLWVRSIRSGDRIFTSGVVKLKKFFIDSKIPVRRRHMIPLVGYDDGIVWVGGLRVDYRYHVTKGTRRVLHLWFQNPIEVS